MPIDPLSIGLILLLAVMVIFMFRNSRKRKRDAEEMKAKLVPGAEVMTQHGIFGLLISVDDDTNEAIIETTPGVRIRVHRQTLARVVDPIVAEEDVVDDDSSAKSSTESLEETRSRLESGEPQYGERVGDEKVKPSTRKKASE